eukprot:363869-Chlamydomonas_euryale.AAC.34
MSVVSDHDRGVAEGFLAYTQGSVFSRSKVDQRPGRTIVHASWEGLVDVASGPCRVPIVGSHVRARLSRSDCAPLTPPPLP